MITCRLTCLAFQNILASACASEVENKRARTEPDNLTAPFSAVSPGPSPNIGMRPHSPAVPAPVGTPEKLSGNKNDND